MKQDDLGDVIFEVDYEMGIKEAKDYTAGENEIRGTVIHTYTLAP